MLAFELKKFYLENSKDLSWNKRCIYKTIYSFNIIFLALELLL